MKPEPQLHCPSCARVGRVHCHTPSCFWVWCHVCCWVWDAQDVDNGFFTLGTTSDLERLYQLPAAQR